MEHIAGYLAAAQDYTLKATGKAPSPDAYFIGACALLAGIKAPTVAPHKYRRVAPFSPIPEWLTAAVDGPLKGRKLSARQIMEACGRAPAPNVEYRNVGTWLRSMGKPLYKSNGVSLFIL
jgi:hypothetical protein